jgi:glycosyltransferase involved in cell wall biosynthesis
VVTVSETCRSEIIERYRLPEEKVVCVYNGPGAAAQPLSDDEARLELTRLGTGNAGRPYVLAVGNLQPRKNLVRLISAFRELVESGQDLELVIAGPEHFRSEQVLAAAQGVRDRIRFTGYLDDRQLAACFRGAAVFAFPSLFEGFGIPALEAMSHDVPVACSGGGALREVCGDAAEYFDPLDVHSIASALRRVLTDQGLRSKLIGEGQARRQRVSWRRAAQETLAVYQQAAGSASRAD